MRGPQEVSDIVKVTPDTRRATRLLSKNIDKSPTLVLDHLSKRISAFDRVPGIVVEPPTFVINLSVHLDAGEIPVQRVRRIIRNRRNMHRKDATVHTLIIHAFALQTINLYIQREEPASTRVINAR